jgi:ABC-type glycerol-3-phosphate transport system substrate-binding protein
MFRSRMLALAAGVVLAVAACGGDTTGPEVDDPATATEADAGGGDTTVAESPTTQPAA